MCDGTMARWLRHMGGCMSGEHDLTPNSITRHTLQACPACPGGGTRTDSQVRTVCAS